MILINIFFQKENISNFKLITNTAYNDWFPFIKFLNNNVENISQNEELTKCINNTLDELTSRVTNES